MSWSARQYTRFEEQRNRPIKDLLASIPTPYVADAVDIGCGPGNSTELLQQRYPAARVTGMDSSPDMVAAARKRLPQVRFEWADIDTWSHSAPGATPYDVILANAALQWVPDQATLLPALVARLTPGGSLAVQIPDNLDEPAHQIMRDVAADKEWATKLAAASSARAPRHSADWYFQTLRSIATTVDVWRTVYHHPLPGGANAIVEWFKGTGLRPFLDPLDENERQLYLDRYRAAIDRAYPALADGTVLLPFPRLFFVATR